MLSSQNPRHSYPLPPDPICSLHPQRPLEYLYTDTDVPLSPLFSAGGTQLPRRSLADLQPELPSSGLRLSISKSLVQRGSQHRTLHPRKRLGRQNKTSFHWPGPGICEGLRTTAEGALS